jgi:undecaprenyl-diphosphatase
MNAVIQTLISLDQTVFQWINSDMGNAFFDMILPWFRERFFWAPLYLFIVSFFVINYRKKGWFLVAGLVLTVGLTDFTSSTLVKKHVERLRPCREPALEGKIVMRTDCGGGFSFTSSHAANHFAAAVFLSGFLGAIRRWIKPVALCWAGLISLSQVYVGLHYPGDVICGALIGIAIAWWSVKTIKRFGPDLASPMPQ